MFLTNPENKKKKDLKELDLVQVHIILLVFSYRLFIEVIWAKERTFSVHHFSRGVR